MSLRIRRLALRAQTKPQMYGVDIEFKNGLNVFWADNTKGKSTCIQAMIYALGLEKMLSPRREIPLPHVMTSYLETDNGEKHSVLESRVAVELENDQGQVITVTRPIKSEQDSRLVSVDFGAAISEPKKQFRRKDFFVLDPGAATREDGFHHFLEAFLGWTLPFVRRFDAPDCKLYLETVFPLFWVEQKFGWSSIPAAIPTYFRIREVQKRAVEFLMDLDVHRLETERQGIVDRLAMNTRDWRQHWEKLSQTTLRMTAKLEGLPDTPTGQVEAINAARILVADKGSWIPLEELISQLRLYLATIDKFAVPKVEEVSTALSAELDRLNAGMERTNSRRLELYQTIQLKRSDIMALARRLRALEEDLQKNQDVLKLQRYSGASVELTPDRCPTCEQSLQDTLLSQTIIQAVMPVEDNIGYLKSQLTMFNAIATREKTNIDELERELAKWDRDLAEIYSRVRVVRADMVAPSASPSAAVIEERVRAEARIRELEVLNGEVSAALDRFHELGKFHLALLQQQSALPSDRMTAADKAKIELLTDRLREQASLYGFSTFFPAEITISEESYKPQKEGFELGFETSASDAIRLKWAYQIGLLELQGIKQTNHPGFLIFDEPRQQSSSKVSFEGLLKRAAEAKARNQQVIFSTSEDLDILDRITDNVDCHRVTISGYVIKPM